jgi:hypothetical protein
MRKMCKLCKGDKVVFKTAKQLETVVAKGQTHGIDSTIVRKWAGRTCTVVRIDANGWPSVELKEDPMSFYWPTCMFVGVNVKGEVACGTP